VASCSKRSLFGGVKFVMVGVAIFAACRLHRTLRPSVTISTSHNSQVPKHGVIPHSVGTSNLAKGILSNEKCSEVKYSEVK
jgi:hypothetical protein